MNNSPPITSIFIFETIVVNLLHMIKVTRYSHLNMITKRKFENHIESEFGDIPIVKDTKWAKPDWTILLYQNNEILSFYNIVEINICIDDNPIKNGWNK